MVKLLIPLLPVTILKTSNSETVILLTKKIAILLDTWMLIMITIQISNQLVHTNLKLEGLLIIITPDYLMQVMAIKKLLIICQR